MDDLLEERFCSIDTEISNQNEYLHRQFEKQKQHNEEIRQAVYEIAEKIDTKDVMIHLIDDVTDDIRGTKRIDDKLTFGENNQTRPDVTNSKYQETHESQVTNNNKDGIQIQDMQNTGESLQTVVESRACGQRDPKHNINTVKVKPNEGNESSNQHWTQMTMEPSEFDNVLNWKGQSNQEKQTFHEHQRTVADVGKKAREVTCSNDKVKPAVSIIKTGRDKKYKSVGWKNPAAVRPATTSVNTFSFWTEDKGDTPSPGCYGVEYLGNCNPLLCSSDSVSETVFSDNDSGYEFDIDMHQSYPGGVGSANLECSFTITRVICPIHGHIINVRKTLYTLESPNGQQKKWTRVDKYRPWGKPPDMMSRLPYPVVPTRLTSVGGKRPSTRSPKELKGIIMRSHLDVFKDKPNGQIAGPAMHTLYQLKEILGENEDLWEPVEEALKEEKEPPPRVDMGADTILCLDNSGTMPRKSYLQLKEMAIDFINGIEDVAEMHALEENIGVVSLGSQATVLHHLSNDFGSLREAVDKVECGGVSSEQCLQLQSLLVCLAALTKGGVCIIGGRTTVPPRLIFVTDGMTIGKVDQLKKTNDAELFFTALEHMGSAFVRNNVVGPIQVVPYGEGKKDFLSRYVSKCQGQVLASIREACNHQLVQKVSAQILDFMIKEKTTKQADATDVDTVVSAICSEFSSREKKQIFHIVRDRLTEMKGRLGLTDVFDNISIEADLPDLGTRVVRGPDWRWDDQDDGGAGTIINHGEDGESLWVSWDNGFKNVYRYGVTGNYDVLIADDQPRVMKERGSIDIGMQVERGPDWQERSETNATTGCYGTVIRKRNGRVMVVWKDSSMHEYRFGEGGQYEVSIREPLNCPLGQMAHMDNVDEHCPQGTHGSVCNLEKEVSGSYVWQWRGKDNKWRLYSEGNNRKLKASYKKRPGGSCLIQRDGRSFRVLFKPLVEKSIGDGSTTDVRKHDDEAYKST
ncbi:uncharacterized protein LOC124131407 isoform X2 [Haliotis rufescens]|uniref:uncharacterized protein LOC124131407 isoform X2 n=1 Tax=Haliotis rufescens TaxID=6454 RepID=UPI00201F9E52|nr:uncharacterized protein LOC124131407 isoform X2 [Haliotis rufescens]